MLGALSTLRRHRARDASATAPPDRRGDPDERPARPPARRRARCLTDPRPAGCAATRGQATTEYALVLLAAALVALLVVGWATAGGGAAKVGRLFDRVIDSVIDKV